MVNVTLKTTLISSQNRHPPPKRKGYVAPFPDGGDADFLLRRSLYLRHTNGAARIKTRLSNQLTFSSSRRSHYPL